jgi:hypothetical protein
MNCEERFVHVTAIEDEQQTGAEPSAQSGLSYIARICKLACTPIMLQVIVFASDFIDCQKCFDDPYG